MNINLKLLDDKRNAQHNWIIYKEFKLQQEKAMASLVETGETKKQAQTLPFEEKNHTEVEAISRTRFANPTNSRFILDVLENGVVPEF